LEKCRRRHNSKERRLDPQITIGLLTEATGFPLTVAAFEDNKAETATVLPVINAFKIAHHLTDVVREWRDEHPDAGS
jgi:transposase